MGPHHIIRFASSQSTLALLLLCAGPAVRQPVTLCRTVQQLPAMTGRPAAGSASSTSTAATRVTAEENFVEMCTLLGGFDGRWGRQEEAAAGVRGRHVVCNTKGGQQGDIPPA